MTTKTLTGAYAAGYALKASYYGLSITSTASVGGAGVSDARRGDVANTGSVAATSGLHSGIYMADGGAVHNGYFFDFGSVTGYDGIVMATTTPLSPQWSTVTNYGYVGGHYAGVVITEDGQVSNYQTIHGGKYGAAIGGGGTVRNAGTISSGDIGVSLANTTDLFNGTATDDAALITGVGGVRAVGSETFVTNYATISGAGGVTSYGVALLDGATLSNGSAKDTGALIKGADGVTAGGAASSVINSGGTITGTGQFGTAGVYLVDGGALRNEANGDIYGYSAVIVGDAGVVRNYGLIGGKGAAAGSYGVTFSNGGALYNGAPTGRETAEIGGYGGVSVAGAAGSVFNYADIVASGLRASGVDLYGGTVRNGGSHEKSAYIAGANGVTFDFSGTLVNAGVIKGSLNVGVVLNSGGSVTNGALAEKGALIQGYYEGVSGYGATAVTNFGTISGTASAGTGVYAADGGMVTNGAAGDTTALIIGALGLHALGAAETVRSFGTIEGASGYGVYLASGGTLTNGSASDTKALIEGYGGADLQNGVKATNFGLIKATSAAADGAFLTAGASLVNGSASDKTATVTGGVGLGVAGAATVTNFGTIDGSGGTAVQFGFAADILNVEAGSVFVGAVLGDGGTLDLASGSGTLAGLMSASGGVTVSGSMPTTVFSDFGTLEVAAGAAFAVSGPGAIAAGQRLIVAGTLTTAAGAAKSITNAGLIETTGAGKITIKIALTNTGTLYAVGGVLMVDGAVTGTGRVDIKAGTADFAAGFDENVAFVAGATGVLELADAKPYGGKVSGFSTTGSTSLDLRDIAYVNGTTTAVFSGTASGGTLTVTTGGEVAKIKLTGDYLASTFTPSSDGHGGTMIVDPTQAATPQAGGASARRLIEAMASFDPPAASTTQLMDDRRPAYDHPLAAAPGLGR